MLLILLRQLLPFYSHLRPPPHHFDLFSDRSICYLKTICSNDIKILISKSINFIHNSIISTCWLNIFENKKRKIWHKYLEHRTGIWGGGGREASELHWVINKRCVSFCEGTQSSAHNKGLQRVITLYFTFIEPKVVYENHNKKYSNSNCVLLVYRALSNTKLFDFWSTEYWSLASEKNQKTGKNATELQNSKTCGQSCAGKVLKTKFSI